MIGHLRGRLLRASAESVVIDTASGVGYAVSVPAGVRQELGTPGDEVELHVHTHVREDQIALFGFATVDELEMFRMLIEVDGVGPKVALAILSSASLDLLKRAIVSEYVGPVRRAPGVGAKTAAKVIIELKPRLEAEAALAAIPRAAGANGASPGSRHSPVATEVEEALRSLGYSSQEARTALGGLDWSAGLETRDALAQALKALRR